MSDEFVTLSLGGGGKQTADFIKETILKNFDNEIIARMGDAAHIILSEKCAFTTDSFVIKPEFFSGGNIGKLSICGTVNDLAVSGAIPKYLSFALVVAEGYSFDKLKEIIISAGEEALKSGVKIVCGDTKVMERGALDGVIINTAGVGILVKDLNDFSKVATGDKVIITSDIARHGMAIMLDRGRLGFSGSIESDCRCLNIMLEKIYPYDIKFIRDATRGGVAAVLNEIAEKSGKGFIIDEAKLPIEQNVLELCETLGFDPLSVANEGAALIVAAEKDCEKLIKILHNDPFGKKAAIIGEVVSGGKVVMKTKIGGMRYVEFPPGEILPRIC